MDILNPYMLQFLTFLLINLILATGMYITLLSGQLSLGHAGFMSMGAYTAAILTIKGYPFLLSLAAGAFVPAVVALIIGFPTFRLSGLYLAVATLGFGEVVRVVMLNLTVTNGALGIKGIPSTGSLIYNFMPSLFPSALSPLQNKALASLLFTALLTAVIMFLTYRMNHSRIGRAMNAIQYDETAALSNGIRVNHYKMLSFVLGALLAGLGGGLFAHVTTAIIPDDFNYHRAVEILSFAVIGGIETMLGPIFGTILLTSLPEMLRSLAHFKLIVYGVLLMTVMAFRPHGIVTNESLTRMYTALTNIIRKIKKGDSRYESS